MIKLSTIKPNPNNPRLVKDDKFLKLVESIKQFGEKMMPLRPMVVDENNILLGGNMRYKALKELNYKEVPESWIKQASDLTEEEKKEFIIKDNIGFGIWDWDALANEWDAEELEAWGLDIPGFDEVEELEAEEDDYEQPEQMQVDVALGDLIEIGEHRLLCGDSTCSDSVAKLMNREKADMVFTSPPYNGNTVAGFEKDGGKTGLRSQSLYLDNETDNKSAEDYIQFNADIFNTIKLNCSDDCVILYNINYNRNSPSSFIDIVNEGRNAFDLVETIIWEKSMAISLAGNNLTRIIEFIFVFFNGDDKPKMNKTHTNECIKNLWKISNNGANHELHKACFPVDLVSKGLNLYSKKEDIIYEPFTGSGTTMVAAHQLKRKCYGMELDAKYCQVIIDRMLKLDDSLEVKINGKEYKGSAVPF